MKLRIGINIAAFKAIPSKAEPSAKDWNNQANSCTNLVSALPTGTENKLHH